MPNIYLTDDAPLPHGLQSIHKHKDSIGRNHFRSNGQTALRAKRFEKTQLRILKGHAKFSAPADRIAAGLVCFEGVATRQNLELALVACANPYRWGEHVCIEWLHNDKRQDRRFLSELSIAHLTKLPNEFSWREAKLAIKGAALLLYPSAKDPVGTFIGDAQAWLLENIPGALLGHLVDTNPLSALPMSALARQSSGQALVQTLREVSRQDSDAALGFAFECYFQGGYVNSGGWLIDRLISITRRDEKQSEPDDKKRMVTECLLLSNQLANTDKISSLILAWVTDLVESGTTTEADIHPGTVQKYVHLAAPKLRLGLLGKDIETLDAKQFGEIYADAKESVSEGQRGTLASALSSWHKFLMRWLSVPPLLESLHIGTETLPKANVIWPNELACIREDWLDKAELDERLLGQLRVAFSIAGHARIRATELFQLRLRSISVEAKPMEIEICPMLRDGSPKTPSARRIVKISDAQATQVIADWKIRRRHEEALEEDLLFGDPHNAARVFRLGQFYVAINQILKAVAGDREISLHTLSHTWISSQIHDALLAAEEGNINRLDQIAVEAGHMTVATSLEHYFHRFEFPLRHHLDLGLKRLPLTSAEAAELSGIKADALRQRTHASGQPKLDVYWEAIFSRNADLDIPDVTAGISTEVHKRPSLLQSPKKPNFSTVLNALSDLTGGMPNSIVASRSGQSLAWVEHVATSAIQILVECNVVKPRAARKLTPTVAMDILQSINNDRAFGIDFRRIGQEKYVAILAHMHNIAPDSGLDGFLDAWRESYNGRFISLLSFESASCTFAFLHRAGIRPEQLAISIAAETPETPDIERLAKEAELRTAFLASFSVPPLFDWKKPRRGRPNSYLIWSSDAFDVETEVASAAISIAGFNAIMLSVCVFRSTHSPISKQPSTFSYITHQGK